MVARSKVAQALRYKGFTKIVSIPKASTPIGSSYRAPSEAYPDFHPGFLVKFHDPKTKLDCDINVNNQLGLRNTALVKHYCDILPILRPMILFIKHWAKRLGLNNPAGARSGQPVTFNSYALMMMTIGLLQVSRAVGS